MSFKITYLEEENLMFGGRKEEKDPRIGLNKFGPFKYLTESELLDKIKLGIIGDKSCIEKGTRNEYLQESNGFGLGDRDWWVWSRRRRGGRDLADFIRGRQG